MAARIRRRRLQFRLRTMLVAVTLLILVGNGFLVWWRTPFYVERRTNNPAWKFIPLLQQEVHRKRMVSRTATVAQVTQHRGIGLGAGFGGGLGGALNAPNKFVFREKRQVYRTLRGEYVNHGPLIVYGPRGRRLRIEHWSHGKLHGRWTDWDLEGQPIAWGEYVDGRPHGVWRTSENARSKGNYTEELFRAGVVVLREQFIGDRRTSRWRYDRHGELLEMTRWNYFDPPRVMVQSTRFAPAGNKNLRMVMQGHCLRGGKSFRIGAGSTGPELDKRTPRRIRDALESPTSLQFSEAPLDEAIEFIAALHAIPLRLHRGACRQAGIDLGQPVTANLDQGLSLHASLQELLPERHLSLTLRNGELLVTPGERSVRQEN